MSNLQSDNMSTASFYGKRTVAEHQPIPQVRKKSKKYETEKVIEKYPFEYLNPECPSSTWKVFHKQKDALKLAKQRKKGVMTFLCQSGTSGERRFLVAHPEVFWFYDLRRDGQRCSYEIIEEHALCKLYFVLEFTKELNPLHVGTRMTDTFIKIVAYFLQKELNIVCTKELILDLDSSTAQKFSRHLIYQLPKMCFQNNCHVGNFVRKICNDLRSIKKDEDIIEKLTSMNISGDNFLELFIDNKGKQQLFCDEGVYSKNRHFRLYCSSEWNKKAPLLRSEENKWLRDVPSSDKRLFLDSLITYFPVDVHYFLLQCDQIPNLNVENTSFGCDKVYIPCKNETVSPYPDVDKFITYLAEPGTIYRWCYSISRNLLSYDIVGNRACNNIGREHRSDNIRLVVDLQKKCIYQKCYAPDCRDYCSKPIILPTNLMFSLEGSISFESLKESVLFYQDDFEDNDDEFSEIFELFENPEISDDEMEENNVL